MIGQPGTLMEDEHIEGERLRSKNFFVRRREFLRSEHLVPNPGSSRSSLPSSPASAPANDPPDEYASRPRVLFATYPRYLERPSPQPLQNSSTTEPRTVLAPSQAGLGKLPAPRSQDRVPRPCGEPRFSVCEVESLLSRSRRAF